MDTGSSDLWVIPGNSQITLTNTTNITTTEQYGSGIASGAIQFAQLEFGGFTIPYQGTSHLTPPKFRNILTAFLFSAFLLADTVRLFGLSSKSIKF